MGSKENPYTAERMEQGMKITVTGRQMTVRDSLREMVEKKLTVLDKYFGDEVTANVTFRYRKNVEMIEITIPLGSTIFRSEQGAETFRTALDLAVDALERQIRKNKTRLAKRLRAPAFEIPLGEGDGECSLHWLLPHAPFLRPVLYHPIWDFFHPKYPLGCPSGSAGKESSCNVGDLGLIPELGKSPGEGNGYLLRYSGLENSMDCVVHEVAKSWAQLSDFHFYPHTLLQCFHYVSSIVSFELRKCTLTLFF